MATDTSHRARLLAAAQALGLALSEGQIDQLLAYLALMQRWNKVYNLTALRLPDEMLSHHLIDCLAVLPPLCEQLAAQGVAPDGPLRLLDVGSGGGLPGVVLAITQPQWAVDCVDTVGKKASFIRQVAAELGLARLQGLHARVEALPAAAPGYGLITSRAFASLGDFTRLSRHLLAPGGLWMAMKGKPPANEQAALPVDVAVFHVKHLPVPGLDAQRCLVWMRPNAAAAPGA
jgi:16S rRNA (guanine527-N7)-methyltransferase